MASGRGLTTRQSQGSAPSPGPGEAEAEYRGAVTRRDAFDMFLLSAFWGVSFLMIKWAGHDFPPLWVALLRSVFGGAVLLLALAWRRERLPERRTWPLLALLALVSNAFPWLMFAVGELTVSSNIAAILNATTPLFTLLLAAAVGAARIRWATLLGVLVGLGGVGLTVSGGVSGGQASLLGAGVILLASLSYGVGNVLAKGRVTDLSPLGVAAAQMIFSTLWLLPAAALGAQPAGLSMQGLVGIAVLGVFGSGLAYLVFYSLLARVSSTQSAAVTYLLPIWGLFWGALTGEHVSLTSLLGVGVVLAGLLVLNAPVREQPGPIEQGA